MGEKKKVLVVVAHPDDETIWMGGTLLKNKHSWQTTILSLCRSDDNDRAPRFKAACKIFGARGLMSDLEDEELKDIPREKIIKMIFKLLKEKNYDYIFTHGKNGEYGHKRHIDVHQAVREMLRKELLMAEKKIFFSYIKRGSFCCANEKADKFIYLNAPQNNKKKEVIQNVYGFKKNSFEEKSSEKIESFDIEK